MEIEIIILEDEPMVDELRHAFELAQQQSEGIQRYIAKLVRQELSNEEIVVTRELAAKLATAQTEIAAGEVRDYEDYWREHQQRAPWLILSSSKG